MIPAGNKQLGRFLVALCVCLCLNLAVAIADDSAAKQQPPGILALQPPFNQWYDEIADNPRAVIEKLQNYQHQASRTPLELAQIHFLLADSYGYLSLLDRARQHTAKALGFIDANRQPWLYHQLLLEKALVLVETGDDRQALELAQSVARWASTTDTHNVLIDALITRAMIEVRMQNYLLALNDLQDAQQLSQSTDEIIERGDLSGYLAVVYQNREEPALALPYFEESVKFNREHGNDMELSIALYGVGESLAKLGQKGRARGMLTESRRIAEKIGDEQGVAYADWQLARLDILDQRWDSARQRLKSSRETFEKGKNIPMLVDAWLSQAQLEMALKNWRQAEEALRQAEALVNPDKMPRKAIELKFRQSELLASKGQYAEAYRMLKNASEQRNKSLQRESSAQLHEIRTRYEWQAQQAENQLLNKQNELQAAMLTNQEKQNRIQRLALLLLTAIIVFLLLTRYRSRQHREKLQKLASYDSLTGLLNRRNILNKLQHSLNDQSQNEHTLALVDFDDFKKINDRFGHMTGDKVLQEFGAICKQVLANGGWAGRVGGEEFLLVLPNRSLARAEHVLEELARLSRNIPQQLNCPAMQVQMSAGLMAIDRNKTMADHLDAIDKALYRAKRKGKNRIEKVLKKQNRTFSSEEGEDRGTVSSG